MDLLIFDLDGTLVDTKLDLAQAVNTTRSHMGMAPLENERVYSYVGHGAPSLIRLALGGQASEAEVEEALDIGAPGDSAADQEAEEELEELERAMQNEAAAAADATAAAAASRGPACSRTPARRSICRPAVR